MKVTLTNRPNYFRSHHRKDYQLYKAYIAIDKDFHRVVDCRIYFPKMTAYCCIWVNWSDKNIHLNGSGSAGGGGYDKPSAAAGGAIHNCGIDLSENIDGRGSEAIKEAVEAIAKKVSGKRVIKVIETYA